MQIPEPEMSFNYEDAHTSNSFLVSKLSVTELAFCENLGGLSGIKLKIKSVSDYFHVQCNERIDQVMSAFDLSSFSICLVFGPNWKGGVIKHLARIQKEMREADASDDLLGGKAMPKDPN